MDSRPATDLPPALGTAATLTYHGRSTRHLSRILRILDHHGFRASFYAPPSALFDNLLLWQDASSRGHEIGNASLHGVTLGGVLHNWTLAMVEDDLRETEKLLQELFPLEPAYSFAYPGPTATCVKSMEEQVEVSYEPLIRDHFAAALTHEEGTNEIGAIDLQHLRTVLVDEADKTLEAASSALEAGCWMIFRIEDLAGQSDLAHARLCEWLSEQGARIVVEPVSSIARRLLAPPSTKR